MFDDIGRKIKKIAGYQCFFGVALSIIVATIVFATAKEVCIENGNCFAYGWLFAVLGSAISIYNGCIIYGIGELIQKQAKIQETGKDQDEGSEKD